MGRPPPTFQHSFLAGMRGNNQTKTTENKIGDLRGQKTKEKEKKNIKRVRSIPFGQRVNAGNENIRERNSKTWQIKNQLEKLCLRLRRQMVTRKKASLTRKHAEERDEPKFTRYKAKYYGKWEGIEVKGIFEKRRGIILPWRLVRSPPGWARWVRWGWKELSRRSSRRWCRDGRCSGRR